MIRSRLIPLLLLKDGSLVKTKKFNYYKYIGDPLNAVRIFNEKNVDELILLDISSTTFNTEINFSLIKDIANQCRMPICYGGGIKNLETVEKIISLGVEKVAFGSVAFEQPNLIKKAINCIGAQSVVIVLDYKKPRFSKDLYCFIKNGKVNTSIKLNNAFEMFSAYGVGELVIQSIERDGTKQGYDMKIYENLNKNKDNVITLAGGAGTIEDLIEADRSFGPVGLAAGSLFVLHGLHDAVLLTYPTKDEKLSSLKRDKKISN